jgi:hypothetical protein
MGTLDVSALLREVKITRFFFQIGEKITFRLVGKEIIDFTDSSVVCDNIEALVIHVKDQILTLLSFQNDEETASKRRSP